jgi:MFS family permease
VGKKKHTARFLYHLPGRLSRLRPGFALTQNIFLIAALFVYYGLYQGIFRAVGKAFASDFLPDYLRASGVGWYSTTVGLLQLVASVVAGLLWDQIGHTAVFYYGAVFAAVGTVGLPCVDSREAQDTRHRRNDLRPPSRNLTPVDVHF